MAQLSRQKSEIFVLTTEPLYYGNLVVWVEESRRRLGIAESLVRLMIKKCYEEEIEPMYVVKTDNHASIALATKLGFEVKQRELVVSYTN